MTRRELIDYLSDPANVSFSADALAIVLAGKNIRRRNKGIPLPTDFWILQRRSHEYESGEDIIDKPPTVAIDELNDFLTDLMTHCDELVNGSRFYLSSSDEVFYQIRDLMCTIDYMPVDWLTGDFAPLVRNIQSFKYYNYFMGANPELKDTRASFAKDRLTLDARVSRYTFYDTTVKSAARNGAIDVLREKNKKIATFLLCIMTDEEFERIITERKRPVLTFSSSFSAEPPASTIFSDARI